MSTTQDLGICTAYGYAKAGGYTGTVEEFEEWLAKLPENVQQALTSEANCLTYENDVKALVKTVSGTVGIDDSVTGSATTWSSNKLNTNLTAIYNGGVNLFRPTLATTTSNGITLTNNNDGTYTANGTATANVSVTLGKITDLQNGTTYHISGFKSGSTSTMFLNVALRSGTTQIKVVSIGTEYNLVCDGTFDNAIVYMVIRGGATCSNVVVKPMFSTDTSLTYDDFVPYIEQGVSQLNNSFDSLQNEGIGYPTINGIANYTDSNGTYHKNLGCVDLGTLAWTYDSTSSHERMKSVSLKSLVKVVSKNSDYANIVCAKFTTATANNTYDHYGNDIIAIDTSGNLWVYDSSYTDATTFASAMSGVLLYYELATPQTWTDKSTIVVEDDISPTAYSTSGLNFSNCSLSAGGYAKVGKMAMVNIRITLTDADTNEVLNGLPNTPTSANIVGGSALDLESKANVPFVITNSGSLLLYSGTSGHSYIINTMYLCK